MTDTSAGRRVEYGKKAEQYQAGDFWFYSYERDGVCRLGYACPHCGELRQIPISITREPGKRWGWNGDKERPTIEPSIRHIPGMSGDCDWHGYLRNGEWITV